MTGEALLRLVAAALRDAQIPFMVTGSIASAYHGAGRATMDLDLVIDPAPAQLDAFVARIAASGAYVSLDAARSGPLRPPASAEASSPSKPRCHSERAKRVEESRGSR